MKKTKKMKGIKSIALAAAAGTTRSVTAPFQDAGTGVRAAGTTTWASGWPATLKNKIKKLTF